jgi:hypothetical protein
MSRNAVIVALVLALVLGVGVLLTTPRDPARTGWTEQGTASAKSLAFDPARVSSLEVHAGSRIDRLECRASGEWWLSTGQTGVAWPVDPSAVRGLLRILSNASQSEPASGTLSNDATRLILGMDDGRNLDLRVDSRPLGGRVIVAGGNIDSPSQPAKVWMTSELHEAVGVGGPRAWRDPAAIPGLGPETARLRVLTGDTDLQLSRVRGSWALVAPIQHPADPMAVGKLLGALANLRIADFMDDKPMDLEAFKDAPIQIAAETDVREIVGDKVIQSTRARQLAIGSGAGLGTPKVHARLDTIVLMRGENAPPPARQTAAFLIDAETVARLPLDPSAYLAKSCVSLPAGEIGTLGFARGEGGGSTPADFTLVRTSAGWARSKTGASSESLAGGDAEQLAAFLRWLCDSPCDSARIQKNAPKLQNVIRINGQTLGGSPAAALTLGLLTTGQEAGSPTVLVVVDHKVVREYRAAAALELFAWIDRLVPR